MELINVSETPMEIINPGNGLPGIAPCMAVYDNIIGGYGGANPPVDIPPKMSNGSTPGLGH